MSMNDQPEIESSDVLCSCGELHNGHICWLTRMGLIMEVHHLSCDPTVSCLKCGAKANQSHNVCYAEPLN